ncbi:hypothetical protein X975_23527, partial [Stegodyphus mimosarum]
MPISTVYKVIKKKLRLHAYKVQNVQVLEPDDRPSRMAFATDMLRRIEDDDEFLKRIMFSDEASVHLSSIVNRHNVRIWESENHHEYRDAQRDSPKVNVCCGLMHDRVIGPFVFTEKTVSSAVYLDMLENFVFPQLEELQPNAFLQQDGAPPHWGTIVRSSLNDHFTGRLVGRGGPIPWPPRSPDITPLNFFLWEFVKDNVYRRSVSNIDDLKARITTAIASVDADMIAEKSFQSQLINRKLLLKFTALVILHEAAAGSRLKRRLRELP